MSLSVMIPAVPPYSSITTTIGTRVRIIICKTSVIGVASGVVDRWRKILAKETVGSTRCWRIKS